MKRGVKTVLAALIGVLAAVAAVSAASVASAAVAVAPDPALVAEQARLESGADLSSRAQRVLFRARGRQDEGAFQEAADLMTEWLEGGADRDHHLLRFNLALSYFGLERPADALAQLERAVALAPRYARGWLRLGEAAYELGKYAQAGDAFTRAYDLGPDRRSEILYYAGASLLTAGEAVRATDALARLVDSRADTVVVDWYQALVAAAAASNKPDRAAPYLQRLLSARPDDPRVWDLAYRFHAGQGDYETAAVHLAVAGYLRPLGRSELVQLGDLYAAIGVPLQAARTYQQAFTADTEPTPADYRKLASAWLAAHQLEAAREVLGQALARRPTRDLWALKGDLEYTAEDYEAALAAFRSCIGLDDSYGRGHLMMGYCASELGQDADARVYLGRAAEFPDQREAAQALLTRLNSR